MRAITRLENNMLGIQNQQMILQNEVNNIREDVERQSTMTNFSESRRTTNLVDMRIGSTVQQNVQTIAHEHIVPEDQKIKKITLKSTMKLFEDYNRYLNTSMDKTKTLASFISTDALKNLVDNENKINTSLLRNELTYSTVHSADNEVIKKMIANKIRPQTAEEYSNLIYSSITPFRPLKLDKSAANKAVEYSEFVVKNYDNYIHPAVLKLLDELESFDNLFRLGVTPAEISYMPKLEYGTKKNPGAFRIFMQCFGEYKENYTTLVTEEKLKVINSLDALNVN